MLLSKFSSFNIFFYISFDIQYSNVLNYITNILHLIYNIFFKRSKNTIKNCKENNILYNSIVSKVQYLIQYL